MKKKRWLCIIVSMLMFIAAFTAFAAAEEEQPMLVTDARIDQVFQNGTLYLHPKYICYYYVPNEVNEDTQVLVYYGDGTDGSDHLYKDGMTRYFTDNSPNAIFVFAKENGYNHIEEANEKLFAAIAKIMEEVEKPWTDMSVAASGHGSYPAIHAVVSCYNDYGVKTNRLMMTDIPHAKGMKTPPVDEAMAKTIADAETMVYFMEWENAEEKEEIPALTLMKREGVECYYLLTVSEYLSAREKDVFNDGVLSWLVDEPFVFEEGRYRVIPA